ncbi:MAG: MMPL family transporter [Verrucomicrobiota bacterium]|jgi:uncharacterized protein|nr:MMPL family transporter [Verrucomicrobiota bacterium]
MKNPFLAKPIRMAIATFICLTPLFYMASTANFSSQAQKLLATDERQFEAFQKLRDIINHQDVLMISMYCPKGVFNESAIQTLHEIGGDLGEIQGVSDIKSLTRSTKPVRSGLSFDMVPLATPQKLDKDTLEALENYCLTNPLIRNVMVSADGMHTLILATFSESIATNRQASLLEEVTHHLARWRLRGFEFHILALPIAEFEVRQSIKKDIQWMLPTLVLGITAMLVGFVKSKRLLIYVLLQSCLSLACGLGLMSLIGKGIPLSGWLMLPFWATIQWTLLIHCISACDQCREEGQEDPIDTGINRIFKSAFFALLTTAVGIGSLASSPVPFIREMGWMGATGVVVIFLTTFGPGMIFLRLFFPRTSIYLAYIASTKRPSIEKSQHFMAKVLGAKKLILTGTFCLVIIGFAGLQYAKVDIHIKSFLNEESHTRRGLEHFDKAFGGANIFQMEIDTGRPNGAHQRKVLKYLEVIQRRAEENKGVSGVYTYAQLLAMMHQIWRGDTPSSFHLPESDLLLGTFASVLQMKKYPFMRALVDGQSQKTYVVVRTPDMESKAYLSLIRGIVDVAKKELPEGCSLNVQQGLHQVMESDRRMLNSLLHSAIWTSGIIFVLLSLLWRSPKLGMMALLVNMAAVVMVLGGAGWIGIPFNTFTVMIGAMAFGIAVDDAVHFISHWQSEQQSMRDPHRALVETLRVKGRPIVFTSLVLVLTFAVFTGSSFPPIRSFGGLCALAFAAALFTTCIVLPCLIGVRSTQPQATDGT